ncbi:putative alpha-1,6-mannosyltransferase MNN10 [Fusarium oxysporum f. sp. albedinis]|nr:putative alpha-1,6-mannosyltransferase MNN10 [Fusarium oxysporum f. sp. albedinis]
MFILQSDMHTYYKKKTKKKTKNRTRPQASILRPSGACDSEAEAPLVVLDKLTGGRQRAMNGSTYQTATYS